MLQKQYGTFLSMRALFRQLFFVAGRWKHHVTAASSLDWIVNFRLWSEAAFQEHQKVVIMYFKIVHSTPRLFIYFKSLISHFKKNKNSFHI